MATRTHRFRRSWQALTHHKELDMKMHAKSLAAAVRGRSRLGAAVGLLFVLLTSSVPASAGDCTVTFYRDTYADGGSSHDHSFSVSSTDAEAVLIPNLYDIKTGSNFEGPGSSMDTWDDRQPERDFTDMISRVGFSGDCSSAVAYLYDHEAYGGLMLEVRPPGVDDLRTVNMHDKATSMRVYFTPQPFCEVCLYTGQNYGGARKKCFDSRKVESVAHANLCTREWQFMESSTVQCFRDDVTSISFEGGACGAVDVWIYDKEDFQGSRAIIERSVANLGYFPRGDDHWNDEVKSFRIGMQGLFDLPRADVASGKYILQAWDGRPVTVQGDGSLIAGGVGTRFGVYNRGNGDHAIQGNSTWLNADANGLHSSAPNGDYTEQHFRLFDVREGVIGIQAKEGRWLFTDENDGGQIHLNPGKVPHWWAFSLVGPLAEVESGKYILQAWDGRPVTVQSDGTLLAGGTGTRFGVYDRGNGEVAIQGGSTWLNAGDYVRVDAPNGDFAEQHFKLIDLGDGTVGIQTSAGEWLFTDEHYGGQLSSNSAKIPHWWTFSLVGPLADVDTGHYTLNDHSGQSVTVQSDGKLFAGGGRGTDFGVYDRGNGEFAIQGGSAWLNAGDHVR
ncbi:MAG: hypothetical protein HOH74_23755, partial [Gemmatimonadetes bacterium]|nr:hypothetical protein [Gemmatimonadota bacterium]